MTTTARPVPQPVTSIRKLIAGVALVCRFTAATGVAAPPPAEKPAPEYYALRGGLDNCRLRFERDQIGRVAFLGGSITEGGAWRDRVCQELRRRFPFARVASKANSYQ